MKSFISPFFLNNNSLILNNNCIVKIFSRSPKEVSIHLADETENCLLKSEKYIAE